MGRSDRITILLAVAGFCVTVIGTGFWMGNRIDGMGNRIDRLEARLETRLDRLEARLDDEVAYLRQRIDTHIDSHGATVEVLAPGEAPGGLAYADGRLFLADGGALRELDPETGDDVRTVSAAVLGQQVATVHPDGDNLVLSGPGPSGSTRVTVWDPEENDVVVSADFDGAVVDALAYGGDLVVSAYGAKGVLRFHPETPDQRTPIGGKLPEPAGLALRGRDLFVADRAGSVFRILEDGETAEPAVEVATGLDGPEGLAADRDGGLYVVEGEAGRVRRIDVESGKATVVAHGLAPRGREAEPAASGGRLAGIAVDDDGKTLFVSAWDRVYRIER